MNNKTLPYWLAVEESKTVRFSELAYMMAKAMHPGDHELMSYAAAHINLETELKQAVRDGVLTVRNAAGMGRHTFPHGDALQRAVLIPSLDLEPFLNARGIELRLTPHGSGPRYWTLENAAIALQAQEGWHDGTRATFQDELQEAAQRREVVIRDPQTCLPVKSKLVRTFWELVTPADVNAWLEKQAAPYRWKVDPSETEPEPAPVVADSASNAPVDGITTAQVAAIFDAMPFTAENWPKRLSDAKWLKPAQVALGAAGGATSLWCPATLARLIHRREQGTAKQKTIEALNRKFKSNPALEPWRTDWDEHYTMFNDADGSY